MLTVDDVVAEAAAENHVSGSILAAAAAAWFMPAPLIPMYGIGNEYGVLVIGLGLRRGRYL